MSDESTKRSQTTDDADATELERSIGPGMLTLFVVGNLLGAGIYAIVGEVAGEAGGAMWAAFMVATVLAVFTCLAYLELVTKYPEAGGAGLYAAKAFRRPWVTLVVTVAVAASAITSAATSARAFAGDYLGAFVELPAVPVAIGFIAVLSIVNFLGISESLKANAVMTLIVVSGLLLVIGVGAAAVVSGQADTSRLTESGGGAAPLAILGGGALAFFAYVGFEDTAQVAEETRDATRTLPIGLIAGLAATSVLYLLVAISAAVVVPPQELAASTGPLLTVVRRGSSVPGQIISGIALVALTNTALLQLVAASRLLYGIAKRGLLPRPLESVHAQRRTPWVAIVTVGAVGMALAATGGLGALADTTVMLLLSVFVVVDVSALLLRSDHVDHDHIIVPRVIPLIGAVVSAGLVVYTGVTSGAGVLLRYGMLLVAGLAVYAVQRTAAPHTDALDGDDLIR